MRILHTADWHLGHRLYNRDRTPEHRLALDWLLETVEREAVDLLIVAGDIFDVTNPSNQAKELYYDFLARLTRTRCASAVIVGGNHDSPSLLNAPRSLMEALQLYVVGAASSAPEDRVLRIDCGKESVWVAAVPYLRERDLRKATFGEGDNDREQVLRAGIVRHFDEMANTAEQLRRGSDRPIVATGHLFASGASDNEDKKSYIYQADEHNILAEQFPSCFDYVALGHIHRAQRVGGHDHIRYAGSLIPLTFQEGQVARSVRLIDLGRKGEAVITRKVNLPTTRPLLRLRDTFAAVKKQLARAAGEEDPGKLPAWAEVRVLTDDPIPQLREKLQEAVRKANPQSTLQLIRISRERQTPRSDQDDGRVEVDLDELPPEDVFDRLCVQHEHSPEVKEQLKQDFAELRNWMAESEEV
jgi:exonuclease SbcD